MIIYGAQTYTKNHIFERKDIVISGERILRVEEAQKAETQGEECLDAGGLLAIPGLVDIHVHGADGADLCDGTQEAIHQFTRYEASNGILAICPATMSFPEEKLQGVIHQAALFKPKPEEAALIGLHLEGPFLSKGKSGAQDPDHIIPPDQDLMQRLLDHGEGLVRLVSLAPEKEGALELIRSFKDRVRFSLAHSSADYETAAAAFSAGVSHITHTFNAMNGIGHRDPGPVLSAYEAGAWTELICDGVHIHPAVVRMVFDLFPPDKVVLISDSMMAAGLSDGTYELGGQRVSVKGSGAVLADDGETIAGSVTNLFQCMKNAIRFGVKKELAIRAATENPAESISLGEDYGSIAKGRFANILLVDEEFKICRIINRGKIM